MHCVQINGFQTYICSDKVKIRLEVRICAYIKYRNRSIKRSKAKIYKQNYISSLPSNMHYKPFLSMGR